MDAASLESYQGVAFELKSSYFPLGFNGSKFNISLYTLNWKCFIGMCEMSVLKP